MTWIDWLIVGVLLFSALHGLRRGFLEALIGVVGVIAAYLVASISYRSLAGVLVEGVHLSRPWAGMLAYATLLAGGYVFIGTIAAVLLDPSGLSVPNRLLGFVAGAAKGALLSAALLGLLMASPFGEPVQRDAQRSSLAPYAVRVQRDGAQSLASMLPDKIRPFGAEEMRF